MAAGAPSVARVTTYEPFVPTPGEPLVVAHRGNSGLAPENTLGALELAIRQGADLLEIDTQLTADGELVVIHDATLVRTTDAPRRFPDRSPWDVRAFTLAEIRELASGEVDGTPQQVPTLHEVLELVRRHDVGLLIETKTEHTGEDLEPAIGALVRRYDDWQAWVPARLMVGSFEWASLHRAARELPGVNLAFILVYLAAEGPDAASGDGTVVQVEPATPGVVEPGTALVELRDRLAADGVGYLGMAAMGVQGVLANDFTAATVSFFRAGGVEINFITDDPDVMRRYAEAGVTSILTNRPDVAVDVLRGVR